MPRRSERDGRAVGARGRAAVEEGGGRGGSGCGDGRHGEESGGREASERGWV